MTAGNHYPRELLAIGRETKWPFAGVRAALLLGGPLDHRMVPIAPDEGRVCLQFPASPVDPAEGELARLYPDRVPVYRYYVILAFDDNPMVDDAGRWVYAYRGRVTSGTPVDDR